MNVKSPWFDPNDNAAPVDIHGAAVLVDEFRDNRRWRSDECYPGELFGVAEVAELRARGFRRQGWSCIVTAFRADGTSMDLAAALSDDGGECYLAELVAEEPRPGATRSVYRFYKSDDDGMPRLFMTDLAFDADAMVEKLYACRQLIDQLPSSEPLDQLRQLIRELSADAAGLAGLDSDLRQWGHTELDAIARAVEPRP